MTGRAADQTDTIDMRMTRLLPATPEQVFDAYTDAEKQKTWFSILDTSPGIVEIEVDLRVGGKQTAVWGPDRDSLFRETQTFLVIDRPHRLVTESTGSSPDGMTMTTRIEMTFESQGDATLVTVVQSGFPSVELRDFFTEHAWVGAFDRIAAFLEAELGAAEAAMTPDYKTVDDYIGTYPEDRQQLLQKVRAAIHRGVPGSDEKIRYGMPAVMLGGRYAIHFAGWKNHIGLYAVPTLDEPLETEISQYCNKDALAFRWSEPIPFDVIERVSTVIAALHQPAGR